MSERPGVAMCTICGFSRPMDDAPTREGVISAVEFALHFIREHPGVPTSQVSEFIVAAPLDSTTQGDCQ